MLCALIVVAAGVFWYVGSNPTADRTSSALQEPSSARADKNNELLTQKTPQHDIVLIRKGAALYELDLATKALTPRKDPRDDIRSFAGLPKETTNSQTSVLLTRILLSRDKTKAITVFTTFDETAEPSAFDGSLPALNAEAFICTMADRTCTPTDDLAAAHEAVAGVLGFSRKWFEYNNIGWHKWDSAENLLFGHPWGEGIGSAGPVYVFDFDDNSLRQTVGYSFSSENGRRAEVPYGAFSPSLRQFVMIDESQGQKTNTWALLLYDGSDLSKPKKQFNIPALTDPRYPANTIESVAWSADEKLLVWETHTQIGTMSLETGEISMRYTDTSKDESGLWLDFNIVTLSPSGRYIVFTDYEERDTPRAANTLNTVLKAIDLQNNNAVIELLRERSISLDYYTYL